MSRIVSILLSGYAWWLLVLGVVIGNASFVFASSRQIDFLQVEANEGNASGGHTAIRFATETFHFLHESSGSIRIQRLDSQSFDHIYAMLGNRGIHESSIPVSEDTYAALLDGFNHFLVVQDEQLRVLESFRRDVRLFELLLEKRHNPALSPFPLALKGLGYFIPNTSNVSGIATSHFPKGDDKIPFSQFLRDLKERIGNTYGKDFIEKRVIRERTTLSSIHLRAAPSSVPELTADHVPIQYISASAAYDDALLALEALQILKTESVLVPGSYWITEDETFKLSAEEKQFLKTYAESLENNLLLLANSSRSDWGFPFIIGMARLEALETSINSGTMIFLDIFPDTPLASDQQPAPRPWYLASMKREADEFFLLRRKEFFNGMKTGETDFAAFEQLGNTVRELDRSIKQNVQPRKLPEVPIPSRSSYLSDPVLPNMSEPDLQHELNSARLAENEYSSAFGSLYEYDLFTRNCVTEIFSHINKSLLNVSKTNALAGNAVSHDPAIQVRDESLKRLGGYIDPLQGLTFIPVMATAEVDRRYRVTSRREIPSYRAKQIAEMKKRESALLVMLRESNTITSSIYRPIGSDSTFLFFTDDMVPLRPLFGAFNVLAGVGESLLGLLAMPVEGTSHLYRGARGILFSLPELFFINVRKGTLEYVAENR